MRKIYSILAVLSICFSAGFHKTYRTDFPTTWVKDAFTNFSGNDAQIVLKKYKIQISGYRCVLFDIALGLFESKWNLLFCHILLNSSTMWQLMWCKLLKKAFFIQLDFNIVAILINIVFFHTLLRWRLHLHCFVALVVACYRSSDLKLWLRVIGGFKFRVIQCYQVWYWIWLNWMKGDCWASAEVCALQGSIVVWY